MKFGIRGFRIAVGDMVKIETKKTKLDFNV